MRKSNIIYSIAAAVVIAIILYFILGKDDAEIPKEADKTEEKLAGIKEVELNEAQFKGSQIELGGFSQKNLSDVINANGYTKLPPQNQADVSVFTTGIVKSISVIEGQHVNKGQVVATIESPEFSKMQEAYLTSKSNLEYLKLEFERQKILSAEEVNSKKVFQQTKSNYETEKARFNSLQKQLSTLNINPNGPATSTVAVKAPIAGFITEINIKLGSNVEAGKPLLGIVDNSKLHVDLLVYEKDLRKVKPGQDVRFILTNQDNTEIKGKIFSVGKSFENETKSVAVHADIINDKQQLIPGMYINALIDIGIKSVSALPVEAIVKADGREFIFVLEEGHKEEEAHDEKQGHAHDDGDKHEENEGKTYHFQRIEVKTGTSQLGFIQATLLQKIDAGSKIVTKGAYYIQSHLLKSEGGGGHDH
ncbi:MULTISPECIES: efflux RND transporter periplasmic adaptor subunit [Flavobacterium]|uniref:Hemolysin D n=1 Tax=Flavobacterium limi TaxID=2045105 RepID=A0ABQ1UE71_9FLAO|nr:efflux RND transporter periplasmic adaptor subunit [Flavobacterium limi]GGF14700.1 hemolysin D [Flavobacterium limi]